MEPPEARMAEEKEEKEQEEEEEEKEEGKGGDENAGEESDVGFRPICRLAWSGSRLAVARFTQLQVYCKGASLPGVGSGPLLPNGTSSVALINTLEWSEDGSRVLVAYDDKKLILFDGATWKPSLSKQLQKKAPAACLTKKSPYRIIYADKQGEIWMLPADGSGTGDFLLGHVSLITDIALPKDQVVILTADRDEKIRVSRFPEAAVIENYCLGHTQFVSRLVLPDDRRGLVVSGSGDNTLRVWNYFTGECLSVHKRNGDGAVIPVAYHASHLAVIVAVGAESHLEILRLHGNTLEPTGQTPPSARVQDAVFDAQGVLWMVNEAGHISAFDNRGALSKDNEAFLALLNNPAQAVAPPARIRRSKLAKRKVEEEPVVAVPKASSLPAYVRKAIGAERPQYNKKQQLREEEAEKQRNAK